MINKLDTLMEIEGFEDQIEAGEIWISDSVVTGICCNPQNPDCNYTCQVERDQRKGWCDECKANTVKSGLILMGVL